MMKLTKRKGFNFFRSYFDVYNELDNDADKVAFIDALLDRQFLGIKPKELTGMAKFAYISQTNSIDNQVKGYEDKTKTRLDGRPYYKNDKPPSIGGDSTPRHGVEKIVFNPTLQEEEKGEEKGEEKEKTTIAKEKNVVDVYENFKLEIASEGNSVWIETFYRKFGLKQKTLSKVMDDFIDHKKCQPDDPPKKLKEFKEHFYNWCNYVDPIGKLDNYKLHKPKQAGSL